MVSAGPNDVAVVEWRPEGHRLAYVAAMVGAARELGFVPRLLTAPEVVVSAEYAVHLGSLQAEGAVVVEIVDGLDGQRLGMVLQGLRADGTRVVVPEADRELVTCVRLMLTRKLPTRTVLILMRPPRWRAGARAWPGAATKTLLLWWLSTSSRIRLLMLEDPLADGKQRAWRLPVLRSASRRLDDPTYPSVRPTLPPELGSGAGEVPVIAVVGVLNAAKQVPLLLEAWGRTAGPGLLVLAGRQDLDAATALMIEAARTDDRVVVIDRYLTTEEVAGVVERCRAMAVLYDGGYSSGALLWAAQRGRWVVALDGTRNGAVAAAHGFATLCQPDASDLARALEAVLSDGALPAPVALPDQAQFGRRIWRALGATG